MRYLIIDASLNGTGIRDKYMGGFVSPEELGLSFKIIERIKTWLSKYEIEHYKGFLDDNIIDDLDREGKELASTIKIELNEVKVEYFSEARMTSLSI